ncbi:hypothetical protein PLEOSDRAFT_162625 [Pleurotus ostreatus PC15]|uniref:DUF6534 domain-containing protein n=1 Tax=Pleurotus ostreatus (strain PC15) TaxID=1137138 RepID=A0A067N6A7_PLEO1|nr:hypothetical protein PLEOSDRAFT_162625 [Pleurotus ostreatus PC15]
MTSRGPTLIGLGLSLSLYGVLIGQMTLYWRTFALTSDKKDKIWIRYLMLYLFGLETVMVFYDIEATASCLFSPIPALNIPEDSTNPLLSTNAILTVLLSTPVQMFLSWRIFALSRGKLIAASIIALAGTSLVSGMMTASITPRGVLLAEFQFSSDPSNIPMVVWLLSSALADILITVGLVAYLHPRKTGFASTDLLVVRIIRLAIQSGMATTACAVAEGILVLEQKRFQLAFYLIPEFILSKLYVNSLFAMLNAREKWNGLLRDDRPTSFLQFNNNSNHNGSEQTSHTGYCSSETLEAGMSSVAGIREEIRNPASGVALNPVAQRL